MGSSMIELQTSQQQRANSVARIESAILARQNDLPPSERATGFELSSGQSRIPISTPLTATQARVGPTTPTSGERTLCHPADIDLGLRGAGRHPRLAVRRGEQGPR
jgi:hypothetical protein